MNIYIYIFIIIIIFFFFGGEGGNFLFFFFSDINMIAVVITIDTSLISLCTGLSNSPGKITTRFPNVPSSGFEGMKEMFYLTTYLFRLILSRDERPALSVSGLVTGVSEPYMDIVT